MIDEAITWVLEEMKTGTFAPWTAGYQACLLDVLKILNRVKSDASKHASTLVIKKAHEESPKLITSLEYGDFVLRRGKLPGSDWEAWVMTVGGRHFSVMPSKGKKGLMIEVEEDV